VPEILPRRRTLLASAAALPLLLATASCRSSDVFTGPDPLAGRPRPAPDVVTLAAVIAAEENLIGLYRTALAGDSAATARGHDLRALLAEHEQHLTRLRARLIQPPGTATAAASPRATAAASPRPTASAAAPARVTIAGLRTAERASAAGLVRRLATVEPALAQLFASIAASDATHVTVLGG
jgi:hypothetical protein